MNDYLEPAPSALASREQIIGLFRGRFLVPALACLSRLGLTDDLILGKVLTPEQAGIHDTDAFDAICHYLVSLDILRGTGAGFVATVFGRTLLKRAGSACILESYGSYMANLADMVEGVSSRLDMDVDRKLNILGSGALHRRKFFQPALSLLRSRSVRSLVDLGCGDGSFILEALAELPCLRDTAGIDMAEKAVSATSARVAESLYPVEHLGIVSDAHNVEHWSAKLAARPGTQLVSMWFVIHEFSGGEPSVVMAFLEEIHRHYPKAELLIGEIVDFDPKSLAASHRVSILPEFLFFHALSGQAPLTWEQWQTIRSHIPYDLGAELLFDCLAVQGHNQPANFIWHLTPKRSS